MCCGHNHPKSRSVVFVLAISDYPHQCFCTDRYCIWAHHLLLPLLPPGRSLKQAVKQHNRANLAGYAAVKEVAGAAAAAAAAVVVVVVPAHRDRRLPLPLTPSSSPILTRSRLAKQAPAISQSRPHNPITATLMRAMTAIRMKNLMARPLSGGKGACLRWPWRGTESPAGRWLRTAPSAHTAITRYCTTSFGLC